LSMCVGTESPCALGCGVPVGTVRLRVAGELV
jgi:hypothetical protein